MRFDLPSGIIGAAVLAIVIIWVLAVIASVRGYRRTHHGVSVYAHAVGKFQSNFSRCEHTYDGRLPHELNNIRFNRDRRRCVYGKLDLSPTEVWEAEIEYRLTKGFDRDFAKRYLILTYDLDDDLMIEELYLGPESIREVANAQLARRR
jgi:hypothetical protein